MTNQAKSPVALIPSDVPMSYEGVSKIELAKPIPLELGDLVQVSYLGITQTMRVVDAPPYAEWGGWPKHIGLIRDPR